MSQIFKAMASGPVPPNVPTTFVTDSGNAVPAANILNVLGNDTTANDADGITTTGAGSTLTILLTNRVTGTASSVNGATADIITFSLGASPAVFRFSILASGRDTGTGDGVGYTVDAAARTNGATATIISTPDIDADEDASLSTALMSFIASGNNVILRATGVVGQTISYNAVGYYVVI